MTGCGREDFGALVRRVTFQPARIMGLHGRGLVREMANPMVFDLDRIDANEDGITHGEPVFSAWPTHRRAARPGAPGTAADLSPAARREGFTERIRLTLGRHTAACPNGCGGPGGLLSKMRLTAPGALLILRP